MAKAGWKDIDDVRVLTFDCHGTLVDRDAGMLRVLEAVGITDLLRVEAEVFLKRRHEKEHEALAAAYRHHRELLAQTLQETLREYEVKVDEATALRFADAVHTWDAFPDAISALRRLGSHWPLAVMANVEREQLERTVQRLGIPFAELVGSDDVRSYKPAHGHFEAMREKLGSRAAGQLHIASNLERDVLPAKELEIPVIWLNRHNEEVPKGLGARLVADNLMAVCEHLGV